MVPENDFVIDWLKNSIQFHHIAQIFPCKMDAACTAVQHWLVHFHCFCLLWLLITLTLVSLLSSGLLFYQDHHGDILERARDALLTNAVIVLQRSMKRFLCRRKHHKQTCAAVIIQKSWKCYREQRIYHKVWFENIFRSSQTSPLLMLPFISLPCILWHWS